MDSVYDAAKAHAEKLKAELETLQNFLNLHDHFRDQFGLTPAAEAPAEETLAVAAEAEAEAPVVEPVEATHESLAHEPEVEAAAEAPATELHAPETYEPVAYEPEAHEPEAHASESLASEPEEPVHAEAEAPETPTAEAASEGEPMVISASEGVLIAASSEKEVDAPLGPEATLQSVAEKLAATISASHPAVTGYTV
jgi:hypothetical protein